MDIIYQFYLKFLEQMGIDNGLIILSWYFFPFCLTILAMVFVAVVLMVFEQGIIPYFRNKKNDIEHSCKFSSLISGAFNFWGDKTTLCKPRSVFMDKIVLLLIFVPVVIMFGLIPYSNKYIPIISEVGVILFWTGVVVFVFGLLFKGLCANNKFEHVATVRSISLFCSCLVPIVLVVSGCVMFASSLNINEIVLAQSSSGGVVGWSVIPGFIGFLIFVVSLLLISYIFDEIFSVENLNGFSGIKLCLLFVAKYGFLFVLSLLCICLFCGGYLPLFGFYLSELIPINFVLNNSAVYIEQIIWLIFKSFLLLFIVIWIKNILWQVNSEKIINITWRLLVPLGMLNFLVLCEAKYLVGGGF